MKKIVCIIVAALLAGCSAGNLDYVKAHAPVKWQKQGFEVVDYEGYHWGALGMGTTYGGAQVWHRLRKVPDNGITYSGYIQRWGDELHVYGPTAIDAIRPR
jgi:hypothetical protein